MEPSPKEQKQEQLTWVLQPTGHSYVRQENRLVEAHYSLTARELKFVLYVCAMVDTEAKDFGLCQIRIRDFAKLAGLDNDHLYKELREIAKAIRRKDLILKNIPQKDASGEINYRDIVTAWFINVITDSRRDGYLAVRLDPELKPFLLQVQKDYTKFQLGYTIRMDSKYSIRLYQLLQRWAYKGQKKMLVDELRLWLGTREVNKDGKIINDYLPAYKNFKQRALNPAVEEINEKSDLVVSFTEKRGAKGIEAVLFQIRRNPETAETFQSLAPLLPAKAPQLSASEQEQIDLVVKEFGLTSAQARVVSDYVQKDGWDYVLEKVAIVQSEPRENLAKTFMAALKGDWQPRKSSTAVKRVVQKKGRPEPPPEEAPQPAPDYSEQLRFWQGMSREERRVLLSNGHLKVLRKSEDDENPGPLVLSAIRQMQEEQQGTVALKAKQEAAT